MVSELLQKYVWLVQTFISAGDDGLSLSDLCSKWERRWGQRYTRRSFNNHREAIEEVFNVTVSYSRSRNVYFIDHLYDVADAESGISWLVSAFTVNSLLTMGRERLSGRISLEKIPSGERLLAPVMEAMAENSETRISYRKYSSSEAETLTIWPYAVKEFERRWYLIGYCVERGDERVYSLDRILSLSKTGKTFKMPKGFDVEMLMDSCYGMYLNRTAPVETIVFCATDEESKFLSDLPLHSSQRKLTESEAAFYSGKTPDGMANVFTLRVRQNKSLMMEFAKRGPAVKILSPDSLAEALCREHNSALELYEKS